MLGGLGRSGLRLGLFAHADERREGVLGVLHIGGERASGLHHPHHRRAEFVERQTLTLGLRLTAEGSSLVQATLDQFLVLGALLAERLDLRVGLLEHGDARGVLFGLREEELDAVRVADGVRIHNDLTVRLGRLGRERGRTDGGEGVDEQDEVLTLGLRHLGERHRARRLDGLRLDGARLGSRSEESEEGGGVHNGWFFFFGWGQSSG